MNRFSIRMFRSFAAAVAVSALTVAPAVAAGGGSVAKPPPTNAGWQ